MLCTVMAWGTDVASKTELQNALNAGGNIRLTDDIILGSSQVTMTSGTVVLDLNGHNLTSTLGNYASDKGALNISGGQLTINATGNTGKILNTGSNGCAIVVGVGAKLIINGGEFKGYEALYTEGGEITINGGVFPSPGSDDNNIWLRKSGTTPSKVIIKGGTFTGATGWRCFQVDPSCELVIEGGTINGNPKTFYDGGGSIVVKGGTFSENPSIYVSDPYYVTMVGDNYQVSHIGSNVAATGYVAYSSLAAAVTAASDGASILLFANDNNSVVVSKNVLIETNGYTATGVSAGDGFVKILEGQNIVISNHPLITFLQGNELSAKTIESDLSFAQEIIVSGTKELTIADDVTISATYVKDACIVVPNGAKLTIYGNGTIAGDRDLIRVEKGGELIIGHADKSDCLKMTTTLWSTVNYAVNNYGKTTINNAEVHAASAALNTYGVMDVNGGYYTAEAYYPNHRYAVTADDGSQLTIKNSRVFGIHGALACQGSAGANIGGSARIENCELVATNKPYQTTKNTTSIHYAIYSASGGIVSVYNTKMRSTQQVRAIHIGNNDAYNTFGLVHVYEGCKVKSSSANNRIWVQKRSATDKEVLFPVTVDENSGWYTAAMNGGEAPLPAGYKWKAIVASGEDNDNQVVDAQAYAEGYRWITVSTATETQEADVNSTTIPWQQSSTWDASASSTSTADVPAATTSVTIPEGKTVVISNDPTENNGISAAVADQVVLGGEGSELVVQAGTTLSVTNGINIASGAKLVVEPGAIVSVGEGGIVSSNDEGIEVKTTEDKSGLFLINPDASENTRPMAKVEFSSRACTRVISGANVSYWQRFASPVFSLNEDNFTNNFAELVAEGKNSLAAGTSFQTRIFQWDYVNNDWERIDNQPGYLEAMEPFRGYTMTNNSAYGATEAVTYTFAGNLVGNNSEDLSFTRLGFNYFGNSYTAPINIKQLLASVKTGDASGNISYVLYVWDVNSQTFIDIPFDAFELDPTSYPSEIPSMHTFIMQCLTGTDVSTNVDYRNNVWGPLMNPGDYAAPARSNSNQFSATARITITADNGETDRVLLMESNRYTDAFDNGADATKYMNDGVLNVYATADFDNVSTLATDNLAGTFISMQTKEATNYVMTFSCVNGAQYAIKDMLTNTVTLMSDNNSYAFSTMDNETIENRFQIIGIQQMPTDVEVVEEMNINAKGIYTLTGQYIGTEDMWYNLPKGMYILNGQKVVK